ncbi:hypothetical protein [Siphonobacter sp. SORGH_AS_0500]|uniref:hypothetical protein n=1 Tax=Siphonobacter sp. SORGH_AS_0500 TaxID=1864824 RepID=UPI000CA72751|nr:hypothetical protein [Siphonobacter sp. SORGH_AS_0500]MDR6198022.1 hypothetical protein [Siphonobacter sp. SORGH_AS_0500]PKK37098.1 hypothetical protein BWI96_06970 [Siphonobacter sp. SORGH_AS_0500]
MTDQERKDLQELRETLKKHLAQMEEILQFDLNTTREEYDLTIKKAKSYKRQIDQINEILR